MTKIKQVIEDREKTPTLVNLLPGDFFKYISGMTGIHMMLHVSRGDDGCEGYYTYSFTDRMSLFINLDNNDPVQRVEITEIKGRVL